MRLITLKADINNLSDIEEYCKIRKIKIFQKEYFGDDLGTLNVRLKIREKDCVSLLLTNKCMKPL